MNYTTWIEIDQSNLEHNVSQYKSWVPGLTGIAPVIKANAYGHGLYQIGYLHDQNKYVTRLCVSNSSEALLLRQHKIKKPILILSHIAPDAIDDVIINNIDTTVSDLPTINILNRAALKLQKKINVHVKIDTGMSRLGVFPREAHEFLNTVKSLPGLNLQGIWSHLSSSNRSGIVHEQEDVFEQFRINTVELHMTNSLGSLNCKGQYDFARVGLGLYGYLLTNKKKQQYSLKPVLSLRTRIVSIKNLDKKAYVGYQKMIAIKQPTRIAVVGIGYFEGLWPDLINGGQVIVRGKIANILSINMNVSIIDITNIPDACLQDVVTILGRDGDKYINAYHWQKVLDRNIRICFAKFDASVPRIIVNSSDNNLIQKVNTIKSDINFIEI